MNHFSCYQWISRLRGKARMLTQERRQCNFFSSVDESLPFERWYMSGPSSKDTKMEQTGITLIRSFPKWSGDIHPWNMFTNRCVNTRTCKAAMDKVLQKFKGGRDSLYLESGKASERRLWLGPEWRIEKICPHGDGKQSAQCRKAPVIGEQGECWS